MKLKNRTQQLGLGRRLAGEEACQSSGVVSLRKLWLAGHCVVNCTCSKAGRRMRTTGENAIRLAKVASLLLPEHMEG